MNFKLWADLHHMQGLIDYVQPDVWKSACTSQRFSKDLHMMLLKGVFPSETTIPWLQFFPCKYWGYICHSRNRTALNILKDSYKYIHFPIRKALVLTMTMSNRCSRQLLRFLQGGACLCGFDGYNQARCTTLLPETSSDAAMQTLQTWIIGFNNNAPVDNVSILT